MPNPSLSSMLPSAITPSVAGKRRYRVSRVVLGKIIIIVKQT